jgi:hypothetical protein
MLNCLAAIFLLSLKNHKFEKQNFKEYFLSFETNKMIIISFNKFFRNYILTL